MGAAELIGRVAEHGVLGLFLAIACIVIYKLDQSRTKERAERLAAETQARADASQIAAQHLARVERLVDACTAAITAQTHVTEGHRTGLKELQDTFKEYVDEHRESNEEVRRVLAEVGVRLGHSPR